MHRLPFLVVSLALFAACHPDSAPDALATSQRADALAWQVEGKLSAIDSEHGDRFGVAVATSGQTVVVGAHEHEELGFSSGAAYIFDETDGAWQPGPKLIASDGAPYNRFGGAVAIDGDTVVVGAPWGSKAYVFTRSGNSWVEEALAPSIAGGGFGTFVAVSGDFAFVSAPGSGEGTLPYGRVFVFERSGTTWSEQTVLSLTGQAWFDMFGWGIAVSGDTILVGHNRSGAPNEVLVFTRSGATWTQEASLSPPDAAAEWFGHGFALEGDAALISSPDVDAVYAFERTAGSWSPGVALTVPTVLPGDELGRRVALAGDTAFVGSGATDGDVVHLLSRSDGSWSFSETVDVVGAAMAVSQATIVSGDANADVGGAAYVFALAGGDGEPCTQDEACHSGFCVDGFCCDSACGGDAPADCLACSAALTGGEDGSCAPVADATPCADDGLFCSGIERCIGGNCESAGDPCDPFDGTCSSACDEAAAMCSAAAPDGLPCGDDGACDTGVCVEGDGGCQPGDCPVGYNCQPDGRCASDPVDPGVAADSGCGCTTAGSRRSGGWALLLGLGLLARRRSRPRRASSERLVR
jgi:MYXO-CTERM domain-containing protein